MISTKHYTSQEIKPYFIKYKNGDFASRDFIIEHSLWLVKKVLKYFPDYKDYEELYQVGSIGLIIAVDNYNLEGDFPSHACQIIYREIIKAITYQETKERQNKTLIENLIMCIPNNDNSTDSIENKYIEKEIVKATCEFLTSYPPFDRNIVMDYFGLNEKDLDLSTLDISAKYGIPHHIANQIIRRALTKIKKILIETGYIEGENIKNNKIHLRNTKKRSKTK